MSSSRSSRGRHRPLDFVPYHSSSSIHSSTSFHHHQNSRSSYTSLDSSHRERIKSLLLPEANTNRRRSVDSQGSLSFSTPQTESFLYPATSLPLIEGGNKDQALHVAVSENAVEAEAGTLATARAGGFSDELLDSVPSLKEVPMDFATVKHETPRKPSLSEMRMMAALIAKLNEELKSQPDLPELESEAEVGSRKDTDKSQKLKNVIATGEMRMKEARLQGSSVKKESGDSANKIPFTSSICGNWFSCCLRRNKRQVEPF
ncbi:hypothetical protein HDU76_013178 [Blyttiomyces sp. JEL0837]|nr:hypothetical protein HDU76_013178 [Blyttiomyces sp. JEL0837]